MSKANIAVRCDNNTWVSVLLSATPKDMNSLRKFLSCVVGGSGERVRDLLTEDNGVYQLALRYKEGVTRTEESRIFLEKSFLEETRTGQASACMFLVSYLSQVTIGAVFLVTPRMAGDDITTSQIRINTTQAVYQRYQNAMQRLKLGAAGMAAFGVLLPALVGGAAVIPTAASAALALSGVGEITWQKIRERKQAPMVVPGTSRHELIALVRTSPGLNAVQNVVGVVTRKNSDGLWVYGFPVEGDGEDISVVIPPSVTEMKVEDDKLLLWVGGNVSSNGKRALMAMVQESELLVQSAKEARAPVLRLVFPEVMMGVTNSYFIDASKTI